MSSRDLSHGPGGDQASLLPCVLSAHPKARSSGRRGTWCPRGGPYPTPGLAFQAPLIPTPAADVTPDAARCGDHGNVALVGWGGQVCAREPEGQAAGSTRQGPQWGARPGLTRTRREGGRGAPRGPLRLAHRLLAQVRACPPPAAPCFPAPLRRGSTRDSSPAAPWGGVTTSAPCPDCAVASCCRSTFPGSDGQVQTPRAPLGPPPPCVNGACVRNWAQLGAAQVPSSRPCCRDQAPKAGSPCSQTQVCLGAAGGRRWGGNGHIIHLRLEPGSTPAGAGW